MLDSIELTLKDISSNMERMIRDREENLTKITDKRRKIHSEIQEERRKINAHLDKLEEQAIANLDAEEAKIKSEIENLLQKLNKKAVTIEMDNSGGIVCQNLYNFGLSWTQIGVFYGSSGSI
jgi:predicted  nucleic acid-binding Zn-ribbon protein